MPAQRGPAQPAKLNKRGTKAQNSKAGSSSSTGKSAAKSPLMTKNTAAKKVVAVRPTSSPWIKGLEAHFQKFNID